MIPEAPALPGISVLPRKSSSLHLLYPWEGSCREKAEVPARELKWVLCELEEKSAEIDWNGFFLSTTPLSSAFALLSSHSLSGILNLEGARMELALNRQVNVLSDAFLSLSAQQQYAKLCC